MSITLKLTIKSLDILMDYPVLIDYIKSYKEETERDDLENQLSELLDSRKIHTKNSWISMLQFIQSVLNEELTREEILLKIEDKTLENDEDKYNYEDDYDYEEGDEYKVDDDVDGEYNEINK
jgi:hypothetical protein